MAAPTPPAPYQWAKVPIPFTGGVDTRSDRKAIPLPKLGLLSNAVFTTPGVLRKRFGYSKLADLALDSVNASFFDQVISDGRALLTRGNSLWLRASENIYSLAADRTRWQRKAQVPSARFVFGPRFYPAQQLGSQTVAVNGERATANGVTMVSYDNGGVITVVFYDANTEIARTSIVGLMARAAVVGSSLCLFYLATSLDKLNVATFDAPALRSSNPLVFSTVQLASDVFSGGVITFDVDVSGGRIVVAYTSSTANTVKFGYVLPGGALDGAFTSIATAFVPRNVCCAVEPTAGTILVCWSQTGTVRVDGQMFTAAKASLFASVTLATPAGSPGSENICCVFRDATNAEIFSDRYFAPAALPSETRIDKATLTTGGVAVLTTGWLRHSKVVSKPWTVSSRVYLLVQKDDQNQGAQKTFYLIASGGLKDPSPLGYVYPNEALGVALFPQKPTRADVVGSTIWLAPTLTTPAAAAYAGNIGIDYSHTPTFVEVGGGTYFTGTSLWLLDGSDVVEAGFSEFPEVDASANFVVTSATGGGLVGGATNSYSYRGYYEWFSATGERFLSTFGGDIAVPLIAGRDTITIQIPTLRQTLKTSVNVVLFRTLLNAAVFHRVAQSANLTTQDTITFVDTMNDTVLASREIDYRSSSPPELSNLAPQGAPIIAVGNTRVLLAGFEDPDLVIASKLRSFGVGLNFAGAAVAIQLPGANGSPVTALAAIGDSHVAFRATHIYLLGGDGPDNVGSGGAFNPPRVISDDIGCISAAAIVRTPLGFVFQSQKGIYLLGLDLSLSYIGADVERYNGDTVTAAVTLPDRHEVRFTLSTGNTLVLDYLAKQWSVFTIGGLHAVIWQGRHVYLPDATGAARAELAGSYLDDGQPFSWAFESAWIHLGEVQGQQKVRSLQFLGEWMGDHAGIVQVAYDYELAWSDHVAVDISKVINGYHYGDEAFYGQFLAAPGATAPDVRGLYGGNVGATALKATSVYQFKIWPRRQRCMAIKLRWEETRRMDPAGVTTYPWLEGARLNEVALEVGLRGGLWRPGADRTFGG